ncbi:Hypothetical_protein [Hexamita inflata]|uniref:Hypothetical_protein n=1 Tax=Hexamita inflata TaxID=28002 RepID=A0ABP1HAG4_9EUKA
MILLFRKAIQTDSQGCISGTSVSSGSCVCDTQLGYYGNGLYSACMDCYYIKMVVDKSNLSCVSCYERFNQLDGLELVGRVCMPNKALGYAGKMIEAFTISAEYPLKKCQEVVSVDGYSCVDCNTKYSVLKGVIFDSGAPYKCQIDYAGGFIGVIDSESTFEASKAPFSCWDAHQVVSADKSSCVSCKSNKIISGQCVKGNDAPVIVLAVCVPLAVIIIIIAVFIFFWKRNLNNVKSEQNSESPVPATEDVQTISVEQNQIEEKQNVAREVIVQ